MPRNGYRAFDTTACHLAFLGLFVRAAPARVGENSGIVRRCDKLDDLTDAFNDGDNCPPNYRP
jgi:hypothetical protein